jgi:hypothetical protein
VRGRELSKHVAVPHVQPRPFAVILQILRLEPQNRVGEDAVAFAQGKRPLELGMRANGGPRPDDDPAAHDGVRSDGNSIGQLRLRRDDRGRMDRRGHGRSTSAERSSVSAQSAPSTLAVARHLQTFVFNETISASRTSWSPGTTGLRNLQRSTAVR